MAGKRDGLYKRGRYWWARTDPITGRPASTKCSSLESARRWLQYRESLRADPRFAAAEDATIGGWCERIIESKRTGGASEETLEVYEQKLKNVRRLLGDDTKLSKITADVIDHYIAVRRDEGVTDHTISKELTCVWQMLKLAKRSRCFPYDIEELKPVNLKVNYEPRERSLRREEVTALLTELTGGRAAFVCVTVGLGLRLSEASRLLPTDIDLAKGSVFVRGTKTKGARRHIPILSIFRPLVEAAVPYLPVEAAVKNNLRRELLKACKRAGIAPATPNDFRRTCCTLMYEGGVDRDVARRILGHASTAMVDKIYGKPTPEALGALAERALGDSAAVLRWNTTNEQETTRESSKEDVHRGRAEHGVRLLPAPRDGRRGEDRLREEYTEENRRAADGSTAAADPDSRPEGDQAPREHFPSGNDRVAPSGGVVSAEWARGLDAGEAGRDGLCRDRGTATSTQHRVGTEVGAGDEGWIIPGATLGIRTPDLRFTKPEALFSESPGKQENPLGNEHESSRIDPGIGARRTRTLHSLPLLALGLAAERMGVLRVA